MVQKIETGVLVYDAQQNPSWSIYPNEDFKRITHNPEQGFLWISGQVLARSKKDTLIKKHSFWGTHLSLLNRLYYYNSQAQILDFNTSLIRDMNKTLSVISPSLLELARADTMQSYFLNLIENLERPQIAVSELFEHGFELGIRSQKVELSEFTGIQWFTVLPCLDELLNLKVSVDNEFIVHQPGTCELNFLAERSGMVEVLFKKTHGVLDKVSSKKPIWLPTSILPFLETTASFTIGKSFTFTNTVPVQEIYPFWDDLIDLVQSGNLVAQSTFKTLIEGLVPQNKGTQSFVGFALKSALLKSTLTKAQKFFKDMPVDLAHPVSMTFDGKIGLRLSKQHWEEFIKIIKQDSHFLTLDFMMVKHKLTHRDNKHVQHFQ
ncbi:MAG: hypothetical protein U9N57_01205 [Pseudomonadota bacterium]|nr:hypothetical protein [Pseudomonadota bacterium]